ncbi:MAG: DNA-processing protein DprA [Steroidobacteraceae bacterium]|nr:DNA-processing protein DprA [Steroidobacteraceae bacterium]
MSKSLSPNTQAILLLTAPLIAGRRDSSCELLKPGEYKRLARFLRDKQREPADLLVPDAQELFEECRQLIDGDRLKSLLARGFLLSQAVERWQTRAIWVVSRADAEYPRRLKTRLKEDAPPVLYGCGDAALLDTGGLAVVGSRDVDDTLVEYTEGIGRLVARARRTLVSGGARGIDQAAMRGALETDGKVAGVLADSLERTALNREHRNLLMDGQLILVSPYDPSAGFNVGNAMQRNKLIYALADAALVVNSDHNKGGTWAGAVEQLEKLHLVPIYVRTNGETGKGLEALRLKGALPWPNPDNTEALDAALALQAAVEIPNQEQLSLTTAREQTPEYAVHIEPPAPDTQVVDSVASPCPTPAEELFSKVRSLLEMMDIPKTDAEVAKDLNVSKNQAKDWLERLVKEGVLEKLAKPVRYCSTKVSGRLF